MSNNNADLLSYRITRRFETEVLDKDVVENNLYETDRVHNTQYLMSAGTAWLRANPGKTIADLDDVMEDLGISTLIVAVPSKGSPDYELCVPGNPSVKPIYTASFVHGMRPFKFEFLTKFYNITLEENHEKLRVTGYSCPKGQALDVSSSKPPSIISLKQAGILTQLQWASVSVMVELFDVERTYADEVEKITREYSKAPYKYRAHIDDHVVDFLIMPDDGSINIVSEFGTTEKNGKTTAIHVRTFVRGIYRDKVGSDTTISNADFDKMANIAISQALEKFDPARLIDVSESDRRAIMTYLESSKKRASISRGDEMRELQALQAIIQKHITEQAELAIRTARTNPGETINRTVDLGGGMTMTSSTTTTSTSTSTSTNTNTSEQSKRTTVRKNPKNTKEVTADDIQRKLAEIALRKKNIS